MPKNQPKSLPLHPLISWQWRIVIALVAAVPLVFVHGASDSFRLPKLIVLQSAGVVLVALYLIRLLFDATPRPPIRSPRVYMPLAIFLWACVAAAASPHREVSLYSVLTVLAALSIYLIAHEHAPSIPLHDVMFVAIPAAANAIFAILQARGIWWIVLAHGVAPTPELLQVAPTALLGNRNYVGSFLLLPFLVCTAAALLMRGRMRTAAIAALVLLAAGLVASNTVTAIAAVAVGVVALLFVRAPRAGFVGTAVVLVGLTIAVAATPPLRARFVAIRQNLAAKQYDAVVTNRLSAYLAAAEMVRDHPLTGVGPGGFSSNYFDYKILASRKYARVLGGAGSSESFGEAHNDLLQLASEAGLPAALLFIAAFIVFASSTFAISRDEADPRLQFVRLLSLPTALALFVLGLAQFPLQLPATVTTIAFIAGICSGWRDNARG